MPEDQLAEREALAAQGVQPAELDEIFGTQYAAPVVEAPVATGEREALAAQGVQPAELDEIFGAKDAAPIAEAPVEQPQFATPSDEFRWESDVPSLLDDGTVDPTAKVELDEQQISDLAVELNVDPTTQEGINAIYADQKRLAYGAEIKGPVATLEELTKVERPWMWLKGQLGDVQAERQYEAIQNENVNTIVNLAKERGLNIYYQEGEFWSDDETGTAVKVTPDFLQRMGKAKYEIVGGIGGGIAGLSTANALMQGIQASSPMGARAVAAAKVLMAGVGATVGAIGGNQVDYLAATIEAQEDWDAKIAADRAIGTAEMSVLTEVAGFGVFKLGAYSVKKMTQGMNYVLNGNTKGAYQALKESMGYLSDDEVKEIVQRWEAINQTKLPGPLGDKALKILPTTAPGGEEIIAATSKHTPGASSAVSSEINLRAQSLLKAAKSAKGKDLGKILVKDLANYETDTKVMYDQVKQRGIDLIPDSYKFDLDELSIKPLLEHKVASISDPAVVDRLQKILTKINELTDNRSFGDLLDLKKEVNDFRYNKKIVKFEDYKAINETMSTINKAIKDAADTAPNGHMWLKEWRQTNVAYARYKQVKENVLYKTIVKAHKEAGLTDKAIANALVKYGTAIDNTFSSILKKLPPKTVASVESEVVDILVNKHAAGDVGGFRAIQFPALAKELQAYNFKTPHASRIKEAATAMADVYRNDVSIAGASGRINVASGQSIATSLKGKLQMSFLNSVWEHIQMMKPGKKASHMALIRKVGKLLEDPLNTKTTQQVLDAIKDDQNLTAAVKRLQIQIAKEGNPTTATQVYKNRAGRSFVTEGSGRTVVKGETIAAHRILSEVDAIEKLGLTELKRSELTKTMRVQLIDEGYKAIALPDGQIIKLD